MGALAAGEAVECLEKARQIAASVNGKDHPMMESFWDALAEAKKAVRGPHTAAWHGSHACCSMCSSRLMRVILG